MFALEGILLQAKMTFALLLTTQFQIQPVPEYPQRKIHAQKFVETVLTSESGNETMEITGIMTDETLYAL